LGLECVDGWAKGWVKKKNSRQEILESTEEKTSTTETRRLRLRERPDAGDSLPKESRRAEQTYRKLQENFQTSSPATLIGSGVTPERGRGKMAREGQRSN